MQKQKKMVSLLTDDSCEETDGRIELVRACVRAAYAMIKAWVRVLWKMELGHALTPTWSWRNLTYSMVSWSTDAVSVCTHTHNEKYSDCVLDTATHGVLSWISKGGEKGELFCGRSERRSM